MIPWVVLERLYLYYSYVDSLPPEINWVSSQMLGEALGISPDLVRKDMTYCEIKGKPRQGYPVPELRNYLKKLLKLDTSVNSVILGKGRLGSALANYEGLKKSNMHVVGLFDTDPKKVGTTLGDLTIMHLDQMHDFVKQNDVVCGVITVPAHSAQQVCDLLVGAGVKAIWNFAPVALKVPDGVYLRSENIVQGFVLLRISLLEAN
jgi:redox-sensing transcriptional repressor